MQNFIIATTCAAIASAVNLKAAVTPAEHARAAFEHADGDNSGRLEREEARAALASAGVPAGQLEAALDFCAKHDETGDGWDAAELLACTFDAIDSDDNHVISAGELDAAADAMGLSDEQKRATIAHMTKHDKDGKAGTSMEDL
jgi:Ca2+-binding EF-hand superfamily protein